MEPSRLFTSGAIGPLLHRLHRAMSAINRVRNGTPVFLKVLGEKLELDLRHVDRRRALALARLAFDAEVKRVVHPAIG